MSTSATSDCAECPHGPASIPVLDGGEVIAICGACYSTGHYRALVALKRVVAVPAVVQSAGAYVNARERHAPASALAMKFAERLQARGIPNADIIDDDDLARLAEFIVDLHAESAGFGMTVATGMPEGITFAIA